MVNLGPRFVSDQPAKRIIESLAGENYPRE